MERTSDLSSAYNDRYIVAGVPKSKPVALIVGVVCAAVVAAVVAGLSLFFCRRRYALKNLSLISALEATEAPHTSTYRELSRTTKNFSATALLSSSGFGDVYRGTLPSGALVAIKRIKDQKKEQGEASFLAEATSMMQIRHRNLLQLRGGSHAREGLFLVYDFMCNGSLVSGSTETLIRLRRPTVAYCGIRGKSFLPEWQPAWSICMRGGSIACFTATSSSPT